jgi:hypothetical protein
MIHQVSIPIYLSCPNWIHFRKLRSAVPPELRHGRILNQHEVERGCDLDERLGIGRPGQLGLLPDLPDQDQDRQRQDDALHDDRQVGPVM